MSQTSEAGYGLSSATAGAPAGDRSAPASGPTLSGSLKPIALVTADAWAELTSEERKRIQAANDVRVLRADEYGTIVDVQGEDQSTVGTHAGAAVGGAIAGAAYIDHSINRGKYSALGQLAATAIGAAAGSAADTGPSRQFQFRYTVRLGDGDMKYFDEVKASSFRHSVGVCVALPSLSLINTHVCQQTAEALRKRYLSSQTPN